MQDLNYLELLSRLGIPPGSMLMVTADLTRLAILSRKKSGPFDIDLFISSIQKQLGNEGTLIIPSFNFNLKNNAYYNPAKSIPITGALSSETLKRDDFRRTAHPLHSFLVWGKYADELASLENKSSFDKDSPFAFMKKKNASMLLIDTSITAAFTFVHHVEEMERLKYRKYKKMIINVEEYDKTIERKDGKTVRREVVLYAKKPGWTMDLAGLEKLLIEKQVAKKMLINQVVFTLVDLNTAYTVIKDDIKLNRARNLAKFSPELFMKEIAKSLLASFGIHTLADRISHDPGLL